VPRFLIERNFAEQLEVNAEIASAIKEVNDELSLRWVFSFLSADKKKSYCLYEAPNAEAIREAAKRLNIPADTIIELSGEVRPEMFAQHVRSV
jgi:hypothetical protein